MESLRTTDNAHSSFTDSFIPIFEQMTGTGSELSISL